MDILKAQVTGAVGQAVNPYPPVWHSGICDCTQDTGICIQTWCCPLCTFANIQNMRDLKLPTCDCGTFCIIMIGAYATSNNSLQWFSFSYRRELIQRYGINDETICKSCMLGLCCFPCSLCQVQREMGKRQEHCGGCCANAPVQQASLADKAMGAFTNAVSSAIHTGMRPPRMWGSGLCDCQPAECVEAFCCAPCIFGFMGTRLDSGRAPDKPFGMPNAMDPITCCSALWYIQGHLLANRREIVERYNIQGESHTMSCINILCCPLCALAQQRREMGFNGEWAGGFIVKEMPRPANAPH